MKHCTGPCEQGDKPCPCPMACESPEEFNGLELIGSAVIWLLAIIGAGVLIGAFI